MADRWMDERDRQWRDRDWRRSEAYGRGGEPSHRAGETRWSEARSWYGRDEEDAFDASTRDARYGEGEYDARPGVTSGGAVRPRGRGDYGRAGEPTRFASQDYTGRGRAEGPRFGRRYPSESFTPTRARAYNDYPRWDDEEPGYGYRAERTPAQRWEREDDARRYGRPSPRRDWDEPYARAREGRDWDERREPGRGEGPGDFLQRAGERISSWFRGDSLMGGREEERRTEGHGRRGLGPKGYRRSDERISDEVHERLTEDPWLDASDIEVAVNDGEVTLSGHVDNREAKHRAERLIEDLSGVRHVQNNLRVNPHAGLTGAGRGFGSSALEAEMRRNEQAADPGNRGASGLSGRTSTGAAADRSTPDPKRS